MTYKIAFQMDEIASINPNTDSTLMMMLKAQELGHMVYYYQPKDLIWTEGKLVANAHSIKVFNDFKSYYQLEPARLINVASMDVIFMRQDPPFDMHYLTSTYLLELLPTSTLVLNNPKEVRNCPEKLFATHFSKLMPPTIITKDIDAISAFREQHRNIVIKPLYSHGGNNVFLIKEDDENFDSIITLFNQTIKEPYLVQKYLPEIKQGDKRIILINGEIAGAIKRIPGAKSIRSNMVVGGQPEKVELSDRDREICHTLAKELKKRGLVIAGIDVIGDYLIEVNITSPTGFRAVEKLYDKNITNSIFDYIDEMKNKR
jgi:glutathione synthase